MNAAWKNMKSRLQRNPNTAMVWKNARTPEQKQQGVTLIELVFAVTIVGILVAIAYPSYENSQIRSRRSSAQAHLMDIAQQQQQYLLDARSYASSLAALSMTTPTRVSLSYTITITATAGPPPTFTATATPIARTSQASDVTLSINNAGSKTPATVW